MDDKPRVISRRDILRGVGIAGAAAVAAPASLIPAGEAAAGQAAPAQAAPAQAASAAAGQRVVYENLTASEADLLEAMVDRLIPTDALGPGAREAGALRYIDRALGGALSSSRQQYANGLAALDRYSQSSRGKGFLQLTPIEKDSLLMDVESGSVGPGIFAGSSAQFFGMVLGHTRQGMFGDPFYGGNVNFAGWDLLRYPGVRTTVTAADQKALEGNTLQPARRSAYDSQMFNKATAGNGHDHDMTHTGDRAHGD